MQEPDPGPDDAEVVDLTGEEADPGAP
jgi:hypothetical protein